MNAGDAQRERVYAAERLFLPTRRFSSLQEAREFVDQVFADEALTELWPRAEIPRVELGAHNLLRSYAREDGLVVLRRARLDAHEVLHEVAHVLEPDDGHGPRFAGALLWLSRRFCSFEHFVQLRSALDEEGASYVQQDGVRHKA